MICKIIVIFSYIGGVLLSHSRPVKAAPLNKRKHKRKKERHEWTDTQQS